jgi:hypothetical protein
LTFTRILCARENYCRAELEQISSALEQFTEFYINEVPETVIVAFSAHCVRLPQEPEHAFASRARLMLLRRRWEAVETHAEKVVEALRKRYSAVGSWLVVENPRLLGEFSST